jgi:DNA adenine methylase
MSENCNLKPFLKWVGGKKQIVNIITSKIPTNINTYYEPFVGGGSVFLALLSQMINEKREIGKIVISDKNQNLINTYKCIKNSPKRLINNLKKLDEEYKKKRSMKGKERLFYKIRDRYNYQDRKISKCMKAAFFIFLNKTCFRGLYREGPNGFNVGFGNYKNPNICDEDNLFLISRCLNKYKVLIKYHSYNLLLGKVKKGDFVYLDPPYYPINNTSFVKYHRNSFCIDDHEELYKFCDQLNKNGINFLMSNSYTKYNINIYKKYKREKILCKRKIHSKKPQSSEYEILIFNY